MSLQEEQLYVLHPALRSGNGPSSEIFANINAPQSGSGYIFDDFERGAGQLDTAIATGASASGGGGSSDAYGVLKIAGGSTADTTGAAASGSAGNLLALSKKTAFEVRFKKADVASDKGSVFLGLSASGLAPIDGSTPTDHVLAANSVGFFVDFADGDAVLFASKGSSTQEGIDNSIAISNDTYIKLGFVYDPQAADAKRIKIYVNGLEQTLGLSKTVAETAAKFPATTTYLDLSLASMSSTDAAEASFIDWVKVVQEA
jgi:hypothetical protein